MPTKYTLVIESSFTLEEQQEIVDGADAWGAVIEDITFSFLVADRASMDKTLEAAPPENTYYVLRTDTEASIPVECAVLDQVACYNAARIYLPEQDLAASYDSFRKVTGHELGHAWKLQHSMFYNTIMAAGLADMAVQPSSDDGVSYCYAQGCPVHLMRHGGQP